MSKAWAEGEGLTGGSEAGHLKIRMKKSKKTIPFWPGQHALSQAH